MCSANHRTVGEPGIVLELADLPEPPAPAAGEVLIGVGHASINMNDLYPIEGAYPVRPSLPSVFGNEGMGRVLAIGRRVDRRVSRGCSHSLHPPRAWPPC